MSLLFYLDRESALSLHNEIAVDNFTANDTDLTFFSLIRAIYLRHNVSKILDYGAGRNYYAQDFDRDLSSYYIRDLRDLRYGGANVTAVDVTPAVLDHPTSHHQRQIQESEPLPFEDSSFDLIVSDFVFEHVKNPLPLAAELQRVLKPGGWIIARTPNKYGYVALVASLVPNRFHSAVLKYIQPDRNDFDIFPTYYRMNTDKAVSKCFVDCTVFSLTGHWEPQYFFGRKWLYKLNKFLHSIIPHRLGMTSIFIIRKKLSDYPIGNL